MEEFDIFNKPYEKGTREEVFHTLGSYRFAEPLLTKFRNNSHQNRVVKCWGGEVMMSYDTICGIKLNDGRIFFTNYHDYSQTTMEYVKQWCGYGVAERRQMLKSGRAGYITVPRHAKLWLN